MTLFKEVERLTKIDNLSLKDIAIKVSEEAGEVSSEVLAYLKASNRSKSAKGTRESIIEETLDTIIVLQSLLVKIQATNSEMSKIAKNKLKKWESKINKNN